MQGSTKNNCAEIIRNFASMNNDEIASVKERFGLAMSLPELYYCRQMFARFAVDDIGAEELYLIDRLSSSANFIPEKVGIGEFITENSYVSDTYADFMSKRNAICENDNNVTPSVFDLMSCAGRYLCRANKKVDIAPSLKISSENSKVNRFLSALFYAKQPVVVSSNGKYSGLYRKASIKSMASMPERSFMTVIYPSDGMDKSEFEEKLLELCASKELFGVIYEGSIIDRRGIAGHVLKYGKNSLIDIDLYPDFCQGLSFAEASSSFEGALMIIIPTSKESIVLSAASQTGLRAFRAAAFNENKRCMFRVDKKGKTVVYLKNHLISDLEVKTVHKVQIKPLSPIDTSLSPCKATGVSPIIGGEGESFYDSYACGTYLISAAATKENVNPFLSSFYAVIGAYVKLIVRGCAADTVTLSFNGVLPYSKQGEVFGNTVAALLGIYRAQAEFSLPSMGSNIVFSENSEGVTVFAYSRIPLFPVKKQLSGNGSRLYLLTPKINSDGMTDVKDLRAMLSYYSYEVGRGKILSAHAVCGESVVDAVKSMENESHVFVAADESCLEHCPAIAIIAEAAEKIQGFELGCVSEISAPDASDAEGKNETDSVIISES